MKEKEKKKAPSEEIILPYIPEIPIPDPPVPNRAHTEMTVGGIEEIGTEITTEPKFKM